MSKDTLMTLTEELIKLCGEGYGDLPVYGIVGSSGAAYEVGCGRIDVYRKGDESPYDLKDGEQFINIYLGN